MGRSRVGLCFLIVLFLGFMHKITFRATTRDVLPAPPRPARIKSNHAHMLSTTKVPPRVAANVAPPQWSQPRDGLGYAPPAPCPRALFSCVLSSLAGRSRAMASRATLGVGSHVSVSAVWQGARGLGGLLPVSSCSPGGSNSPATTNSGGSAA